MLILLLSILTITIFLSLVLYYCYKNFNQQINKLTQESLKLKKELRIVGASAIGVGQRLGKFEEYTQRLASRQQHTELKQGNTASYAHAMKIVALGGNVDDMIDGCGLTRAEAELVFMLHKKPQAGQADS